MNYVKLFVNGWAIKSLLGNSRLFLFFCLTMICLSAFHLSAQEKPSLSFVPSYQNQKLDSGLVVFPYQEKTVTITRFRCYVSAVQLWNQGKPVWSENNSYHLLDAFRPASLNWDLNLPKALIFDELRFQLGIDSTTQVSGAFGGDLDPSRGMFWTWNSGYIHFKLEGTSPYCDTRKQRFQYHLGGYLPPFVTMQSIALPVTQSAELKIAIRLEQFLETIDIAAEPEVMIPGQRAVELSQQAAQSFEVIR